MKSSTEIQKQWSPPRHWKMRCIPLGLLSSVTALAARSPSLSPGAFKLHYAKVDYRDLHYANNSKELRFHHFTIEPCL